MRIQTSRIIDLSVVVGSGTQVYPDDPPCTLEPHSTIEKDGFNLLSVSMGSQTGTHVDAPFHFEQNGKKIDELPLELFLGRGVIVDATDLSDRGRVTWEHVAPVAEQIEPGCIVLLHTGWSRHYGTDRYFENPFLDGEACRRMIALGVRTFGIDAVNIDETPDDTHPGEGWPVHHLIAGVKGVISENLTNLDAIDFEDPFISLLPIAFEAADGAPVRATATQFTALPS